MSKEVENVDLMGMVRVLMGVKSAVPATVLAVTEEKMNKTSNPYYGRVTKRQVSNIFINFDYAKAVNKRLVKEGKEADFVPSARKWGEKLPGTCLVFHKGEYYLEVGYLTNNAPKVEYLLDGVVSDKSVFETYLKSSNSSSAHQGVSDENEVIIRSFKASSILELSVNGKKYVRTDV